VTPLPQQMCHISLPIGFWSTVAEPIANHMPLRAACNRDQRPMHGEHWRSMMELR